MIKDLLGRPNSLFHTDFISVEDELSVKVSSASFVIVGGAGTIGSSVVRVLVSLKAKRIQIIDISENNLVELIRDIRSSHNDLVTEIETYAMDCGSEEFERFLMNQSSVDYLLNFSALKHVRSERDIYTLKRLVDVNIVNSVKLLKLANVKGCKKYFCVSTDKATNPVNMMGASKLLMEKFILSHQLNIEVSTARFANVAFSDGSLLFGFEHRISKKQPLSVPTDIRRFFVTPEEAGQLCVLSCLLAKDKDIFFPKTNEGFKDIRITDIASKYLRMRGFEPRWFDDESLARSSVEKCIKEGMWPCFSFLSDTTGEKSFEEFYTECEKVDLSTYSNIGVVQFGASFDKKNYSNFIDSYAKFQDQTYWAKSDLVEIFRRFLPNFVHEEKNKNLDQKM